MVIVAEEKSMSVSDNTRQPADLKEFYKKGEKLALKQFEKMVSNVMKYFGRAIEIGAEIDSAAVSESPKAILTKNVDIGNCFLTCEKVCFGNSVSIQIYVNLIEIYLSTTNFHLLAP